MVLPGVGKSALLDALLLCRRLVSTNLLNLTSVSEVRQLVPPRVLETVR